MDDPRLWIGKCTQQFVRATGRAIAFDEHPWLLGPVGELREIGIDWLDLEADRYGGSVGTGGLLNAMIVHPMQPSVV
jgi:hypothetical protein